MSPAQPNRHDPQSKNEDAEDDNNHRPVIHNLLDSILPVGDLVLVPTRDVEGHS